MSELHQLKILKSWDETPSFRGLVLEAGALKGGHTAPGQYLEIILSPEAKGYFALANGPGQENFELLLKRGGAAADALSALPVGASVPSKAPGGKGYPLAQHKGKDILLFAAGSGIAPIRAAAQYIRARRWDFGEVVLFYGQRNAGDFAYETELTDLEKQDIPVVRVLSGGDAAWRSHRGHVQEAFLRLRSKWKLQDPVAYACGMKPMVQGVKDALAQAGFTGERVFQNF